MGHAAVHQPLVPPRLVLLPLKPLARGIVLARLDFAIRLLPVWLPLKAVPYVDLLFSGADLPLNVFVIPVTVAV